MYNPIKDGIKKTVQSVQYSEAKPPSDLVGLVHNFWELKTEVVLDDDFCLHVLPDACINILFNMRDPKIAAITARQTTYVLLNLGKSFHYVGIQFLPGMWQGNRDEIVYGFVDTPYKGNLPLVETAAKLTQLDFFAGQLVLSDLVRQLMKENLVVNNPVTARILADIEVIDTVTDMAASANLSPRQLQRTLKKTTGFSPHDFLKVLRLQQSFRGHYLESYADQSHFIHSFRKITGYTPAEYFKSFNV
ncbi:helix-turn-helix transcriptional regulator [Leptospira sp. 201903075]|uniref:helix-turn-helix domain-containing protein n=1 Tax=Leptospira chreensis TaxID=2810035 RepID=UPI001962E6FD|nr:AraC family transcriptional regulator [Leptospira chreensis]MBM9590140.1 helix-turn-helix transcriptional regulator [Leptospira chreensis]